MNTGPSVLLPSVVRQCARVRSSTTRAKNAQVGQQAPLCGTWECTQERPAGVGRELENKADEEQNSLLAAFLKASIIGLDAEKGGLPLQHPLYRDSGPAQTPAQPTRSPCLG